MDKFDAILIGAGQANNPLARSLAAAGWSVALVERGRIGGSCLNVGCTPTKVMVASAKVAEVARRAAEFGVRTGTVSVDFAQVRRRREGIMDAFRAGGEKKLAGAENLELIRGEGRFLDAEAVAVRLNEGGERTLRAGTIVLDTGSRPARPAPARPRRRGGARLDCDPHASKRSPTTCSSSAAATLRPSTGR